MGWGWRTHRDPHLWWAVCRPSAASPETSALSGPRSPEEERKQDAYQERLFLFFVTDPHLGLGRAICRAAWLLLPSAPGSGSHSGALPLCSAPSWVCAVSPSRLVSAKWGKTSHLPVQEAAVFLCLCLYHLFLDPSVLLLGWAGLGWAELTGEEPHGRSCLGFA